MLRIIDQFTRKRCQNKRTDVDYNLLLEFFQKIFCCTWAVGCKKFVHYIRTYVMPRTVYFGWICMNVELLNDISKSFGLQNRTAISLYFVRICKFSQIYCKIKLGVKSFLYVSCKTIMIPPFRQNMHNKQYCAIFLFIYLKCLTYSSKANRIAWIWRTS